MCLREEGNGVIIYKQARGRRACLSLSVHGFFVVVVFFMDGNHSGPFLFFKYSKTEMYI